MRVELGNSKAVQQRRGADDEVTSEPLDGSRVLVIEVPDEKSLADAFTDITSARGVWGAHSEPGESATWVYSDNEALQYLLAAHFKCEEGRPSDVEATHHTEAGPPGVGPDGPVNKDGSPKASARKAQEDDK